ncbi:MAG: outer membrane protein assembly factor BamD [Stagnimonas sp.]|nr:outer membrane protein assembly factor BamD [Stagnimonas sp.]
MKSSFAPKLAVATFASLLLLAGCSSDGKRDGSKPKNPFKDRETRDLLGRSQVSERELKLEADQLYRLARDSLESGDYAEAQLRYDALVERYPFTDHAVQAELEKIYALHKEYKPDEALQAADRFLREHPRHPRADYVQYLKGVINAERDAGLLSALPLDNSKEDVSNSRKAYDEFSLLLQKYPSSRYNQDASARMVALRNRIAANEMHVVRYYVRRGAYLAAAKRAEQIIAQYPGAPATLEALKTLQKSYTELGLKQQAEDAARILAARAGGTTATVEATAVKTATATPPAAGDSGLTLGGSKLLVSINTGEEEPAASTAAKVEAPVEKSAEPRGFFTRVVDFFSFLDPDREDEKAK